MKLKTFVSAALDVLDVAAFGLRQVWLKSRSPTKPRLVLFVAVRNARAIRFKGLLIDASSVSQRRYCTVQHCIAHVSHSQIRWSARKQPRLSPSWAGHQYQYIQVIEGARAHLGDTHNISEFIADAEEEHHE
jgi:hypothetical protein